MIQNKIPNDRGQVGIGTLIVFIALVLVAAIAAGVLINTAGFLQTQAEQTGQDSTDQVADNINVIGEVGEVTPAALVGSELTEAAIYEQRLTVQRSPGSSEIDLTGLSIQYVGDNGFEQLVHVTDSDSSIQGAYLVQAITAESSGDAVITADGDRYEIVIPIGIDETASADTSDPVVDTADLSGSISAYGASDDVEADNNVLFDNTNLNLMTESQTASLEITTESGATRNVVINAPDTFIDQEGDTVTL